MPTHSLPSRHDTFRTQGMRSQLVEHLRKVRGFTDEAVLAAIGRVPRHLFLDRTFLEQAYEDKAMPIGEGQTISQPSIVALQTSLLELKRRDRVLEIGTGSGYQAAVLSELGVHLYSIERQRALFEKTRELLEALGYVARLMYGDGTQGMPTYAPFQGIIVTAGAPVVPEQLVEQLAPGGRLVIPVGDRHGQSMLRITRHADGSSTTEDFGACAFVPLVGKHGWQP